MDASQLFSAIEVNSGFVERDILSVFTEIEDKNCFSTYTRSDLSKAPPAKETSKSQFECTVKQKLYL